MSNDEKARLAALRSYRILDTDAEAAFDDLTLLASRICQTPIALITLIDEKRQWFKSRVGTTLRETSREIAFCDHAIRQREMFVIPDALADARFRDNPAVVLEPRIRFYTGAPLINPEGQALGTLCVLDKKPRTLNPDQLEALDVLRRQVMAQLELRRNLRELQVALAARDRAESETERLIADLREALEGVRRLAALIPATPACQLDMRIPADVTAVPKVVSGVMQLIRLKGIAAGHEVDVEIAIQEALANAIKHGCHNDPAKTVQCVVACDDAGELTVVVRDPGPGFDVAAVPSPLDGAGLMKESGRGIFLINELMDEVKFEEGGRSILMRKKGPVGGATPLDAARSDTHRR